MSVVTIFIFFNFDEVWDDIILRIPSDLRIILSCLCTLLTLVLRLFHLELCLSTFSLRELLWVMDFVSVLLRLWSYFCLCLLTFFFRRGQVRKKVTGLVFFVMLFFMGFCIILYFWLLGVIERSILLIFRVHSVWLFVETHQLLHFSWQLIENTPALWVSLLGCWSWSWSFDFLLLRCVVLVGCSLLIEFWFELTIF